jgi:hypothetical protein
MNEHKVLRLWKLKHASALASLGALLLCLTPPWATLRAAPNTIWPATIIPTGVDGGPDSAVELGVKFQSDAAGTITGIRFYKSSANTGTHIGNLWSSTGALLGSITFTNETASGWQQMLFTTPVSISPNTVYVASYHCTVGHYSEDDFYFASTGVDSPPLHALANGVSGGNGVYAYGTSSVFPSSTWNTANYWVDVVFQPAAAPTLVSIAVTPTNPVLGVGGAQQFTATGTYSDSSTQDLTSQVAWSSSKTSVATVSASGLATSVGAGSATISAALAAVTGSTTLTVTPALTAITVTPANVTNVVGATQQYTATGTYSDSSTQNLTSQVAWSSSSNSIATINASGLATLVSAGTTSISAALAGVSGSASLSVQAPLLTITTASLPGGSMGSLYTAGMAAGGGTTPYTWSVASGSLPPGLTLNTSSGAINGTPSAAGTFSFTVQVADAGSPTQTTNKSLSITITPTLASISVTPASPSFVVGGTQQFTATGTYSDSSTQDLTLQATWTSSNTGVVSVNATGLATGVSAGTGTITAAVGSVSGGTSVTILPLAVGVGDYRSAGSGAWNAAASWQTNNGVAWVAASQPPTNASAAGVITIQSGHTITVASAVTVDQVVVAAGGQISVSNVTLTVANGTATDLDVFGTVVLTGTTGAISASSGAMIVFESGALYQHAQAAGTIPTATWNANSTCLITGSTSAMPSGLGQTFGHLTWNCASQSANLSLEGSVGGIAGDLAVASTGSGTLRVANSTTARTLNVGRDFLQTGGSFVVVGSSGAGTLGVGRTFGLSAGTFNLKQSSGTANLNITSNFNQAGGTFNLRSSSTSGTGTVTVKGNFALSAGTLNMSSIGAAGTMNVAGSFSHTGGTITETSTGSGAIVFNGSSPQVFTSGGTVANTINFTVNSGATLLLGAQLLGNGSSGTFTLASGGTLGIGDPAGITTSGATGNVRVTGTRSFNTGANYLYNGTTPQVPGNGLPVTLSNLTIANPSGLTLTTTNTITGTCLVTAGAALADAGALNNGPLVLNGALSPGNGVGRLTTARETWNGGATFNWEINNATGGPGTGWDLLSLTNGQGIDLESAATNPFTLKLITLSNTSPGLAANFGKTNGYLWTIAVTTNATVTNFSAAKFAIDTTQFGNDFSGGAFSVESAGTNLQLRFTAVPAQLTIGTTFLPNGTMGTTYLATLAASGGSSPYGWSVVAGGLPPGLALNSASGAITGIPTTPGTFNITLQVADASVPQQTASKAFNIAIAPALTSLTVAPTNSTVVVGGTQQFAATGTYSDGSTQNLTNQVTWSSSNTAVATISTNGLATTLAAGSTTISAVLGGVTNSTTLTVAPALTAITVTPANLLVIVGGTQQFAATGTYSDGSTSNLTSQVSWSSSNSGVATISASGFATTLIAGTTTISAVLGGVTGGTSLTVTPALTGITVTPANPAVAAGGSQQFTATGTYSDGSTQNLTSQVTWSSSKTSVATLSTGGLATAVAAGSATISAGLAGVVGSTTLTVLPALNSIAVTPANPTVVAGGTQQFTATGTYSDGSTSNLTGQVAWSSSKTAVATISTGGLAAAVAAGSATISAALSGVTGSTALTVTPALTGITVTPANATVVAGGTQQFAATGTYSDGSTSNLTSQVTWSSSATLVATISTSGLATAVAAGSTTVSAALGGVSNSTTLTVTPALTSITVTPANPTVIAGATQQFTATGTYSDSSTSNLTSQVTWSSSKTAVATISTGGLATTLAAGSTTISAGLTGVTGGTLLTVQSTPLSISTTSLVSGVVGVSYSATLVASGGTPPYAWSIRSGSLPAGLALNASSGAITGAPTAAGTFSFTAQVSDAGSPVQTASQSLGIIVTSASSLPILLLTNAANPFSQYFTEILMAEGLNEFTTRDVSAISSATLAPYDVVLLGQASLTAAQVTTLSNWVYNGGNLIAMRPDKQLASLLGLVDAGSTLSEGYLLVNTASGPGAGIVGQPIQFHGTADRYSLGSASSVATLYSNALTGTLNPAVTLCSVGPNGGEAAAFTFDLGRSVVYTRQGNPAWSGQERDGITPIRPDDLFYGAASFDPQPDWVDLSNVAIPQADEQQRLLANLMTYMEANRKMLPRFWYFPHGYKAVVVMTGDDHAGTYGGSYAPTRFDAYLAASPAGGTVADWTVPRCTAYIYLSPSPSLTNNTQAATYDAAGFEIGIHLNTGCANYTGSVFDSDFTTQMGQFVTKFPSLPAQTTHRIHCIAWSDYSTPAIISRAHGIRLETSYYFYPPSWVADNPGMFTGSGMPMRFATTNGAILDIYQATTQMTDESGQTYPYTIDTLLDRALGTEGYYGAFVANMHTDTYPEQQADAIFSSATSRGVPIIAARQLLTWVDARNGSSIKSVSWSNGSETFAVQASSGARGLQVMVPVPGGSQATAVTYNGSSLAYSSAWIKGIQYALFSATTGVYQVTYGSDTTPPGVTSVLPANGALGVGLLTNLQVIFSEDLNPTTVNSSTILLRNSSGTQVSGTVAYNSGTLTAVLTPTAPLALASTYTATVKGGVGGVTDLAGNSLPNNVVWSFTTISQYPSNIWSSSASPVVVDGGPDSAVELGVKFRSAVAGSITGIRFYKATANTGTHVGNLWTSTGTLLATATFAGETASGWQQVLFSTPVAVTSNTLYVASYHANNGHYSADTFYFSGQGYDNYPLHALADGENGGNGVYIYGTRSAFPSQTYNAANYWVDVVFKAGP